MQSKRQLSRAKAKELSRVDVCPDPAFVDPEPRISSVLAHRSFDDDFGDQPAQQPVAAAKKKQAAAPPRERKARAPVSAASEATSASSASEPAALQSGKSIEESDREVAAVQASVLATDAKTRKIEHTSYKVDQQATASSIDCYGRLVALATYGTANQ